MARNATCGPACTASAASGAVSTATEPAKKARREIMWPETIAPVEAFGNWQVLYALTLPCWLGSVTRWGCRNLTTTLRETRSAPVTVEGGRIQFKLPFQSLIPVV